MSMYISNQNFFYSTNRLKYPKFKPSDLKDIGIRTQ